MKPYILEIRTNITQLGSDRWRYFAGIEILFDNETRFAPVYKQLILFFIYYKLTHAANIVRFKNLHTDGPNILCKKM